MNILVISSNYPTLNQPNFGAFVYNLMQELGKKHQITIISPYKVHHLFKTKHKTYGEELCKVYRPRYLSVSDKEMMGIKTGKISAYCYEKAVRGELKKLSEKPDIIYCHFLSNALPVLNYALDNHIPLVIASGESTYSEWEKNPEPIKTILKHKVNHIICVSNKNREQLISLGFEADKMSVIPNAVNYDIFKPLNKEHSKRKLGLSTNKFIVGFIGHFIHRKGPNRVIEAIELLKDESIHLICVGSGGELKPNSFTTQLDPMPNYLLPEVYNAFDVFVLPTLNEGHCNVIEEAKACCIPVVSSKGTSVEDQLDSSIGVLVNPLDINEISQAILEIKNNGEKYLNIVRELRKRKGENSIQNRSKRIDEVFLQVLNSHVE